MAEPIKFYDIKGETIENDNFDSIFEEVDGKEAIGIYIESYYNIPKERDLIVNRRHIKIVKVLQLRCPNVFFKEYAVAVFNMNEIAGKSSIVMEVPRGKEWLFLGSKSSNISEWCRRLGLKKIEIVGI